MVSEPSKFISLVLSFRIFPLMRQWTTAVHRRIVLNTLCSVSASLSRSVLRPFFRPANQLSLSASFCLFTSMCTLSFVVHQFADTPLSSPLLLSPRCSPLSDLQTLPQTHAVFSPELRAASSVCLVVCFTSSQLFVSSVHYRPSSSASSFWFSLHAFASVIPVYTRSTRQITSFVSIPMLCSYRIVVRRSWRSAQIQQHHCSQIRAPSLQTCKLRLCCPNPTCPLRDAH